MAQTRGVGRICVVRKSAGDSLTSDCGWLLVRFLQRRSFSIRRGAVVPPALYLVSTPLARLEAKFAVAGAASRSRRRTQLLGHSLLWVRPHPVRPGLGTRRNVRGSRGSRTAA